MRFNAFEFNIDEPKHKGDRQLKCQLLKCEKSPEFSCYHLKRVCMCIGPFSFLTSSSSSLSLPSNLTSGAETSIDFLILDMFVVCFSIGACKIWRMQLCAVDERFGCIDGITDANALALAVCVCVCMYVRIVEESNCNETLFRQSIH